MQKQSGLFIKKSCVPGAQNEQLKEQLLDKLLRHAERSSDKHYDETTARISKHVK